MSNPIPKPARKLLTPSPDLILPRRDLATPRRRQRGFFVPCAFFGSKNCEAVDFDGANDYMTRGAGLTGAEDSKSGILSVWVRIDGGPFVQRRILGSLVGVGFGILLLIDANNGQFELRGANSAGSTVLSLEVVDGYAADGTTWLHFLSSWDLAVPGRRTIHVNDEHLIAQIAFVDDFVAYGSSTNWYVGANSAGGAKWNGCLAELYFAPGQYLDFSVEANRRKFITKSGKPQHLGTMGAGPTGTRPLVYLHINQGQAASAFATNLGTGGPFSETGSLEIASTNPCD